MDEKHKSFRPSFFEPTNKRKWYEFTKMDRREYGYTAIVGLLAGGIFQNSIIGSVLGLAGFVSAIRWTVLTIKPYLKKSKQFSNEL